MQNLFDCKNNQRGVALISVLLIFAVAALIAVEMSARTQLLVRKTGNIIANDQGQVYAIGAESFAMVTLQKLLDDNPQYSTLAMANLPPFKVDEGMISGRVEDLQSRFNINSLANIASSQDANAEYEGFKRLLTTLGFSSTEAEEIASAVVDWLDSNEQPYKLSGVEDLHYLLLDRPYRTANQAMVDLSELRLVRGITDEVYRKIYPYVAALPDTALINLNTVSAEVMTTLHPDIDMEIAQQVILEREENPLGALPEVFKDKEIDVSNVVYESEYYEIFTKADIYDRPNYVVSLLYLPKENKALRKVIQRKKIPPFLAADVVVGEDIGFDDEDETAQ